MTYKNAIISLFMVAVVGLATWATLLFYRPSTINLSANSELPDAYMEDVTALVMDKQGKPQMKIVTPKLVHFDQENTTRLTTPIVSLYQKSSIPWYITSKYAKAIDGVERVDFWENVTITHPADAYNPNTVIKTQTLKVYPNKQLADTNDDITMVQPNLMIKALGMHADMNTGDVHLLSDARGEYVPNDE